MQTDDIGTRPAHDDLDALFADLGEERSATDLELLNPGTASTDETLSIHNIPVIGDGGLLAAFQD
ncbi:hypothetical protein [Prescottella equi]|uniref:hypothetical protein n=1 Tax=Rhodococcus hoagii TaxID=43767 RepID=UPI0002F3330A|nr:hypothetical protein [Prescottella equi]